LTHLLFCERALVGWYNQVKDKAISSFEEVSGGLKRMTVARFEELVRTNYAGPRPQAAVNS
jgi:hypothetical protein